MADQLTLALTPDPVAELLIAALAAEDIEEGRRLYAEAMRLEQAEEADRG